MGKAAASGKAKLGSAAPQPRQSPRAPGGRPFLFPSSIGRGTLGSRSGNRRAASPALAGCSAAALGALGQPEGGRGGRPHLPLCLSPVDSESSEGPSVTGAGRCQPARRKEVSVGDGRHCKKL